MLFEMLGLMAFVLVEVFLLRLLEKPAEQVDRLRVETVKLTERFDEAASVLNLRICQLEADTAKMEALLGVAVSTGLMSEDLCDD